MNSNPSLSLAGLWRFNPENNYSGLVDFYSTIQLGQSKSQGLVLGGWAIPSIVKSSPLKTTIAILDQNSDGSLKLNTSAYINDSSTNGIGDVVVTDFNGDGIDDIFLSSYNERPMVPGSSIVYLSNGVDQFTKFILADSTLAHSSVIADLNGVKTIISAGYSSSAPYYQYDSVSNTIAVHKWGGTYLDQGQLYGSSASAGDFNNDGKSELAIVDFGGDFTSASRIKISSLDGNNLGADLAHLGSGFFTENPNYPGRTTHMYRVWSEDFNHDQQLDLMIGQSTGVADWANSSEVNASKLVLLQNQGDYIFTDQTGALGSAYVATTNNVDYSTQRVDLDNSGINSYLLGDSPLGVGSTHSNYLLLNDGTGKLYAALHDEFVGWGQHVKDYLSSQGLLYNRALSPKFIAYQVDDGAINYLAILATGDGLNIPLVNVPARYNITTDFTQDVTITDRNNSMLMRTWAGNDQFYDVGANSAPASIDGGLGIDVAIYSGVYSQYQVSTFGSHAVGVQSRVSSSMISVVDDALTNVERLQFSDTNLALDIGPSQNAGSVYMLYKAAFNRAPDAGGMGYWIAQKDGGANIVTNIAQGFVNSAEFTAKYGTNPTNAAYVDNLYLNVLGRAGEAGGVAYWNQELNAGNISKAAVLVQFATLAEGASLVADLIANGIPYTEFVG